MSVYIGIDPGSESSAFVELLPGEKLGDKAILPNEELYRLIPNWEADILAIERVRSQNQITGNETFDTVEWTIRFEQAWLSTHPKDSCVLIPRWWVRRYYLGTPSGGDPDITAMLKTMGWEKGTKKNPGKGHGLVSHLYPALAVAYCAEEYLRKLDGGTNG